MQLVVAAGVPYAVRVPADLPAEARWRLRQYAASGVLLRDSPLHSSEAGKDLPFSAPPGRYTLEVLDADGSRATTTFELRAGEPPVVVDLPVPGR